MKITLELDFERERLYQSTLRRCYRLLFRQSSPVCSNKQIVPRSPRSLCVALPASATRSHCSPLMKPCCGPHVQTCMVYRTQLSSLWSPVVVVALRTRLPAFWLARQLNWKAALSNPRSSGAWLLLLIISIILGDMWASLWCREVGEKWKKWLAGRIYWGCFVFWGSSSEWEQFLSFLLDFLFLSTRAGASQFIMSATSEILFGDRSEIPDLLKALADYPFSFPAFDDIGELFFNAVC